MSSRGFCTRAEKLYKLRKFLNGDSRNFSCMNNCFRSFQMKPHAISPVRITHIFRFFLLAVRLIPVGLTALLRLRGAQDGLKHSLLAIELCSFDFMRSQPSGQ